MAEHTPGPWEWTPEEQGWGDCGPNLRSAKIGKDWDAYWGPDGNGTGKSRDEMPPDPTVLSAWGHDAYGVHIDNPADKALMAAAPDLLAALKQIIDDKHPDMRLKPDHIWNGREAIAKAEGRTLRERAR